MRRPTAPRFAIALGAVTAISLGACGEDDAQLLPGGTAEEITANLDTVERLADEGDCAGAESATLQVSEQVEALEGIDPRLERALSDGATRLEEVVADCEAEVEAIEPPSVSEEPEAELDKDLEKEREKAEKQEEKERDREEAEEADEDGGEGEDGGPSLPPEGKGKGQDEGEGGGPGGGKGGPSGGLSPANPAGEGE